MEIAGLTDLMRQEGSYTIFAPTDEAFASLTKEDFDILKSEYFDVRYEKEMQSGNWSIQ